MSNDTSETGGDGWNRADSMVLVKRVTKKGNQPQEVAAIYDEWTEGNRYEQDVTHNLYIGPVVTADAAAESIPEETRSAVRVLDVAAGTGFCGLELNKRGFKNIDALDPSVKSLERAKLKNVYTKFYNEYVDDHRLGIDDNTYDILTCSGGFGEGHIPSVALHEMVRITKPGGFIVIVTREENLDNVSDYKNNLKPLINKLIEDQKWEQTVNRIFEGFFLNTNGIIMTFRKL